MGEYISFNYDNYERINTLSKELNEKNVLEISLEDLRLLAIFQNNKISRLDNQRKELQQEIRGYKKSSPNLIDINIPNFIAIDFETASYTRMACSLGIVIVQGYQIIEELHFLIQPPGNEYDTNCSNVHNIYASDTESSPTFKELWPEIKQYFINTTIVAHNAAFDLDVLKKNCSFYNIAYPKFTSICTCEIHNRANLLDVCEIYNIPIFEHHNALQDAKACALALLGYINTFKVISHFCSSLPKPVQKKTEDFWKFPEREISKDALIQDLSTVKDPNNPFYDKKIVITGVFESFPIREDLAMKLKSLGADINTTISKKTNIVVYGQGFGPVKMQKVIDLQAAGFDIILMGEEELKEKLKTKASS